MEVAEAEMEVVITAEATTGAGIGTIATIGKIVTIRSAPETKPIAVATRSF